MKMERRRPRSHRCLELPPPECCHGPENYRADHPLAFPAWRIDLRLGELLPTHRHRGKVLPKEETYGKKSAVWSCS
ncbi:unnamed protein product [Cuscuta epithymum]|uniref:Uncharacterized protein n=1 Tax=Cuscuta epithymum TaxID=186058 RepID=A0AAV0G1S8_9ASTE|nr:unnamed protein product [Cuscuta epithymum]